MLKWELWLVSFKLLKCSYYLIVFFVISSFPFLLVFSLSTWSYLRSGTFYYSIQELFIEHIPSPSFAKGDVIHHWGTEDLCV